MKRKEKFNQLKKNWHFKLTNYLNPRRNLNQACQKQSKVQNISVCVCGRELKKIFLTINNQTMQQESLEMLNLEKAIYLHHSDIF